MKRSAFGMISFFSLAFALGLYFTFAAVQGEYGLFQRAQIEAETRELQAQLSAVQIKVDRFENLTRRLSDTYLDLDLLDEQARSVLGMARADEIIIR